jgi:hypothetical protein
MTSLGKRRLKIWSSGSRRCVRLRLCLCCLSMSVSVSVSVFVSVSVSVSVSLRHVCWCHEAIVNVKREVWSCQKERFVNVKREVWYCQKRGLIIVRSDSHETFDSCGAVAVGRDIHIHIRVHIHIHVHYQPCWSCICTCLYTSGRAGNVYVYVDVHLWCLRLSALVAGAWTRACRLTLTL